MNKIKNVVIYTRDRCLYCIKAKTLLALKKVQYQEINLSQETEEKMAEMLQRSGGRKSVPQIFHEKKHIGGYDDLLLAL